MTYNATNATFFIVTVFPMYNNKINGLVFAKRCIFTIFTNIHTKLSIDESEKKNNNLQSDRFRFPI